MRKATATYHAPQGDSKVVEMGGVTFFDGKEVELNSDDHGRLLDKLQGNQFFDVEIGEEDDKPGKTLAKKRGRPSAADRAAAKEAADAADKAVRDATANAKAAKAELDATERAANVPAGEQKAPKTQTRDTKAGLSEAADHDFEKDRRDNIARSAAQGQMPSGGAPKPPAAPVPHTFTPPPEA